MIEHIKNNQHILAIIVRDKYTKIGIEFFTPGNFSQQLGYMNRKKGYVIQPHLHNSIQRKVNFTREVLFIKSGKVRIDFYSKSKKYVESRILNRGDVVLLASGGHGFEMLKPTKMIEVKQGPYIGDSDKTIFDPISKDKIKIK